MDFQRKPPSLRGVCHHVRSPSIGESFSWESLEEVASGQGRLLDVLMHQSYSYNERLAFSKYLTMGGRDVRLIK